MSKKKKRRREMVIDSVRFDINGLSWLLLLVYPEYTVLEEKDGTINIGMTIMREQRIYIDATMEEGIFRQTIMHELTHAWILSYALPDAEYDEEDICQFIAGNADNIVELTDKVRGQIKIR